MTVLEIITLGTTTISLLSFLLFVLFLFFFIQSSQEAKKLSKKRAKGAKRKRQLARKRKLIQIKKKQIQQVFISFFILALLFAGGSLGSSYYQAMTLSKEDEISVVKGYFLLKDFDKQLSLAGKESESEEKINGNIRYLASTISSYGTKTASTLNSEEGQLTLNRYYKAMQNLGTNAMRVTEDVYGDQRLADSYQADIKRVEIYQKKVLKLYKVDEAALKKAKSNT